MERVNWNILIFASLFLIVEGGYNEWIEYDGAKYKFVDTRKNWTDARIACSQEKASLLAPESASEQSWVYNQIKILNSKTWPGFWIGIHDIISEGIFVRADGCPFKFSAWDQGEPNQYDGLNEDCAQMGNHNGNWNDFRCHSALPFICKWPAQSSCSLTTTKTTAPPTTTSTSCPPFFSCEPGCLPENLRCDGYIDCWDFYDELNCVVERKQICKTPNPVANGDISVYRNKDGDLVVTYVCLPGFKLLGESVRRCELSSGKWINNVPKCEPNNS